MTFLCGRHGSIVHQCDPLAREPERRTVDTPDHRLRTRCASMHGPCTHSEIHRKKFLHVLTEDEVPIFGQVQYVSPGSSKGRILAIHLFSMLK